MRPEKLIFGLDSSIKKEITWILIVGAFDLSPIIRSYPNMDTYDFNPKKSFLILILNTLNSSNHLRKSKALYD